MKHIIIQIEDNEPDVSFSPHDVVWMQREFDKLLKRMYNVDVINIEIKETK